MHANIINSDKQQNSNNKKPILILSSISNNKI